jgi:hypothetical protein
MRRLPLDCDLAPTEIINQRQPIRDREHLHVTTSFPSHVDLSVVDAKRMVGLRYGMIAMPRKWVTAVIRDPKSVVTHFENYER